MGKIYRGLAGRFDEAGISCGISFKFVEIGLALTVNKTGKREIHRPATVCRRENIKR